MCGFFMWKETTVIFSCLGKQIHTMVAHLDAVTSLSIDPTGLYLLSGSKFVKSLAIVLMIEFVCLYKRIFH